MHLHIPRWRRWRCTCEADCILSLLSTSLATRYGRAGLDPNPSALQLCIFHLNVKNALCLRCQNNVRHCARFMYSRCCSCTVRHTQFLPGRYHLSLRITVQALLCEAPDELVAIADLQVLQQGEAHLIHSAYASVCPEHRERRCGQALPAPPQLQEPEEVLWPDTEIPDEAASGDLDGHGEARQQGGTAAPPRCSVDGDALVAALVAPDEAARLFVRASVDGALAALLSHRLMLG